MVKQFIEVTAFDTAKKHLINVDRIISVIEQSDGTAFVEYYEPRHDRSHGLNCAEGYEKVKLMLVDLWR